jgi:hypothetical protein
MNEQIEIAETAPTQATETEQVNTVDDGKSEITTSAKRFKTEEELQKAYNSLEKEFTKRSQRLKTLEKEFDANKQAAEPVYTAENWGQKVDSFMSAHPEAMPFKGEIAKLIIDGDLKNNPNCLELALSKVLVKNYKAPSQLISDSEFLEGYVFANEGIKNRIINDYLKRVADVRSPKIIGGGGQSMVTPPSKPKSFSEAGQMWQKQFK